MTDENTRRELETAKQEALVLRSAVHTLTIETPQQYKDAAQDATMLKGRLEVLEERRKAITAPLNEALKSVNDLFRTPRDSLNEALTMLRNKLAAYQTLQQEKERALLLEAAKPNASHSLVSLATQAAPTAEGVSFRTDYEVTVTDPNLVPREYMVVDERVIKAAVRASKGRVTIPGVKVVEKKVAAISGVR